MLFSWCSLWPAAPIKAAQSKADYGGTVSVGGSQVSNKAGALYVVATPIGNLDDMSRRAVAVLRGVTVIAAEDTRHSAGLLRHFDIATPLVALHEHNERQQSEKLIDRLRAGGAIALISDAGTPLVRGAEARASEALSEDAQRIARVLLAELPLKQAVALTAAITGEKRNALYEWAMHLKNCAPQ